MTNRKTARNHIILYSGDKIIAEFEPQSKEIDGKITTVLPASQKKKFIKTILADKDHELYDDLIQKGFWEMNGNPEHIHPQMDYVF